LFFARQLLLLLPTAMEEQVKSPAQFDEVVGENGSWLGAGLVPQRSPGPVRQPMGLPAEPGRTEKGDKQRDQQDHRAEGRPEQDRKRCGAEHQHDVRAGYLPEQPRAEHAESLTQRTAMRSGIAGDERRLSLDDTELSG